MMPSFLFIALIHPVAKRLRKAAWTGILLDGVNAALALMTGVLIQLGQHALTDVLTWTIALISFAILLRFKPNSVWLILAGPLWACSASGYSRDEERSCAPCTAWFHGAQGALNRLLR